MFHQEVPPFLPEEGILPEKNLQLVKAVKGKQTHFLTAEESRKQKNVIIR